MTLDDVPRPLLVQIACIAVALALLPAAVGMFRRWLRRQRILARVYRAGEGEREAILLLEELGFDIEAAQATTTYALAVDGVATEISVRADYIVSRGRDRYVAEVKTGRLAPKLSTSATRRQLLEYQHAFDVTGILLVDADARRVHEVAFIKQC